MIKIILLSWALLANTIGAHAIADTIQKPYTGPLTQYTQSSISSFIDQLPIITAIPKLKNPEALSIKADAWLIRDSKTGTVLAQKNGYTVRPPASTIKLMTIVLVLEKLPLDKVVTVSPNAASQPGSSAGLRAGEKLTVNDLLHGLMLQSGNDAAVALAEQFSSVTQFVQMMNDRALQIGLSNTHISDPDGYDEQGTTSTAYDITKLLDYALRQSPIIGQIMRVKDYEFRDTNGKNPRTLHNSDRFVQFDDARIIGGKTGTGTHRSLGGAGHTIVVCAEQDGRRLCAFVGGTSSDSPSASYEEAKKLLDYSFANMI